VSWSVPAAFAAGHPIEYWLAVLTAFGLVLFGWLCLGLRVVNAWCAVVVDEDRRAAVGASRAPGRRQRRRDVIRLVLWRATGAGAWPREWLSLGEWTALGSLVGATVGLAFYAAQGSSL
jgi:hypothetical protein